MDGYYQHCQGIAHPSPVNSFRRDVCSQFHRLPSFHVTAPRRLTAPTSQPQPCREDDSTTATRTCALNLFRQHERPNPRTVQIFHCLPAQPKPGTQGHLGFAPVPTTFFEMMGFGAVLQTFEERTPMVNKPVEEILSSVSDVRWSNSVPTAFWSRSPSLCLDKTTASAPFQHNRTKGHKRTETKFDCRTRQRTTQNQEGLRSHHTASLSEPLHRSSCQPQSWLFRWLVRSPCSHPTAWNAGLPSAFSVVFAMSKIL